MKRWILRVIVASLVLGGGLLVGNSLYSAFLVYNKPLLLPDLSSQFNKPPDWEKYGNLNQAFTDVNTEWNASGLPKPEDPNKVYQDVPGTLKDQIQRIRSIFDEEVRFRRETLNNNLIEFQTRLSREMNQKLEEETTNLTILTTKKIAEKEKELKASFEKYRLELRVEYRKRLVDLNLQVLAGANLPNDFSKPEGLSESQAEIKRIHEEFISKLNTRQQQIMDELTGYTKQLNEANKITLNQLRARLSERIRSEIANFQTTQENNYHSWHQKRSREISQAIELREKNSQ